VTFLIAEFVRPRHQRTPDHLVHEHNHAEHRQHAEQAVPPIATPDGGLM
jgi:hypothetical protein